jgi:hypothetical protein
MSDAALMKALGSAGKKSKLPAWAKLAILVAVLAFAWVLSWEWGLFLILVGFGGWTAWAWWHEKGNIVDSFRDFVLYSALLATALGTPMSGIASGFRGFGPAAVEAVKSRWDGAHQNAPTIQIGPPAPTTTAPPAGP